MIRRALGVMLISLYLPCAAWCGKADVERVTVSPVGERTFRFDVTVRAHDSVHDYGGKTVTVNVSP